MKLDYCVLKSKNNISDWFLLHEPTQLLRQNLVISHFFIFTIFIFVDVALMFYFLYLSFLSLFNIQAE